MTNVKFRMSSAEGTLSGVSTTYAKKTDVSDMATKTHVSSSYATKTHVASTYATKTDNNFVYNHVNNVNNNHIDNVNRLNGRLNTAEGKLRTLPGNLIATLSVCLRGIRNAGMSLDMISWQLSSNVEF